jgi:hypothetical protein
MIVPEEDYQHPDGDSRTLLREWERRNRISIDSHNEAQRLYERLNVTFTILSIGTLVALGTVAASFDLTRGVSRFVVVGLSVAGALASTVQSVRDYGSKAAAHRAAARQYGAVCRTIERTILLPEESPERRLAIEEIQRRWDTASEIAPNTPGRIRDRAVKRPRQRRFV